VTWDVNDQRDLRGFNLAATRAVARAEREARNLGHDRVGTEHLLLGLLTNEDETSDLLADAGLTLAAARNKVREAVGKSYRATTGVGGQLPRTPRASRALGRAARFAHADGSDAITTDHLLWGVLDVEGTAGQVLRGLGIEVDSLRRSLETMEGSRVAEARTVHADADFGTAACPACSAALEDTLSHRVVTSTTEAGVTRDAIVFSCGNCGRVLGVGSA
jgi:ATP-dependent Clp protease ATP-binding subunit ClpA